MSYQYQKTERGQDIVISGWEKGIADSALLGHQQMQNVDIFTQPGIVQAQYKSTLDRSTASLVNWMVEDPISGYIYALTENGVLHQKTGVTGSWSTIGGTPANAGQGLGIWKGYLIIVGATVVSAAPLTALGAWTSLGITLVSSFYHPVYTGLNTDDLFIGNTRYVAQVIENAGQVFNPTNAATFTASANVLDLPSYYTIRTIEGLGNNLYFGTFVGASPNDRDKAVIFPWDKVSDSYDQPISIVGTGIHQLKTIGSFMYLYAGGKADISITNTATTQLYKRFYNIDFTSPGDLSNVNPDAIGALNNEELLIGIGSVSANPVGIYTIRNKVHVLRNLPSTGNSSNIRIGSILPIDGTRFMFSWFDALTGTGGIDAVGGTGAGTDNRYSDYSAQIDTEIIPISTNVYPLTFGQIEFKLGRLLTTGQGIKIWYRTDLSTTFQLINTWDFASIGSKMSYVDNANIDLAEWVQLRIQLKAQGSSSPWLTEIRLRT